MPGSRPNHRTVIIPHRSYPETQAMPRIVIAGCPLTPVAQLGIPLNWCRLQDLKPDYFEHAARHLAADRVHHNFGSSLVATTLAIVWQIRKHAVWCIWCSETQSLRGCSQNPHGKNGLAKDLDDMTILQGNQNEWRYALIWPLRVLVLPILSPRSGHSEHSRFKPSASNRLKFPLLHP